MKQLYTARRRSMSALSTMSVMPVIFTMLLAGCGGEAHSQAAPAVTATTSMTVPDGYSLVWSDEFAVNGLPDTTKWMYDTGMNKQGWHNHELQYYSRARADNSQIRDGKLLITARKEALSGETDWGGQNYTSARLTTQGKQDWTYGYFEIRAKLPCGKGSWPAIWMLGSKGDWPAMGELDIMEQIGKEPANVFSTIHTTAGSGANGTGANTQIPDACTAFHTYQMLWTGEQISFGVDGKIHLVYANPHTGLARWPFDAPQFLILNIAIGGDLGGAVDDSVFPIQMEIDYVRVYQKPK